MMQPSACQRADHSDDAAPSPPGAAPETARALQQRLESWADGNVDGALASAPGKWSVRRRIAIIAALAALSWLPLLAFLIWLQI